MSVRPEVLQLSSDRFDEAVETLCAAFHGYAAMRYLLEDAGDRYAAGLADVIGYFTDFRMARGWPVLGIEIEGALVAVANVNPPRQAAEPPTLLRRFERVQAALGPRGMERFEAFCRACVDPPEPHYYLGMIGVRPEHQGRGLGRVLLEAVHELSRRDPESAGVGLSTEDPGNLALYRHFGYRIIAERDLEELHTWSCFRPDDRGEALDGPDPAARAARRPPQSSNAASASRRSAQ